MRSVQLNFHRTKTEHHSLSNEMHERTGKVSKHIIHSASWLPIIYLVRGLLHSTQGQAPCIRTMYLCVCRVEILRPVEIHKRQPAQFQSQLARRSADARAECHLLSALFFGKRTCLITDMMMFNRSRFQSFFTDATVILILERRGTCVCCCDSNVDISPLLRSTLL